ncbi:PITH domain-containing protein [Apodospora peruviana]|uniref:PITH domain-containing protein n=1 Tax=Apodospora peruviana TaxID=516989 RepID=A0AAE0IR54_9PEZI|nr:PITH domain-containing protein [Apodospora peruviana]
MSATVGIASPQHLDQVLQSSRFVVVNFYSTTNSSSTQIAPIYERLSQALSRPGAATFAKVNVDTQKDIPAAYSVTELPTFIIFRGGKVADKITGADPARLQAVVKKLAADVENIGSSEGGGSAESWRGADLPRGYGDITSQIEVQRTELLNFDSSTGGVRVLFEASQPSALSGGETISTKDWVESDTDEQLLLFLPFQSMLKLHTLQITSCPPVDDEDAPKRPRTIKLFTNKPHNLGFDEAEDMSATQTIELSEKDWNALGTANIPLRYVKFQNINSLVMFVVDGDGDSNSEKVRLDRLRLIGEAGEKREMGKLEKIGDEPGE